MTPEATLAAMVLFVIIGLLFTLLIYRYFYYRSKQEQNRYFLYAVRDNLLLLVAQGRLQEDEFLFKEMYPVINELINSINSVRFKDIVKAIGSQEHKVMGEEFRKRFNSEITGKPRAVVNVFNQFFGSMAFIIYRNSMLFRVIIWLTKTSAFIAKSFEASGIQRIFKSQNKAIQYHQFCVDMKR